MTIAATSPDNVLEDPYLWLEAIDGIAALEWVQTQNTRFLPELESTPGFHDWRQRAETILEDPRRVAWPSGIEESSVANEAVFNFWRDDEHLRGLWRVSPRAAYDAGKPQWRILLDMDALAAAEKENWQFGGATCLSPSHARCLVRLSVGGKDAVEVREFDMHTGAFVPGGFVAPEAKQTLAWLDADSLLIASDFGPDTLTTSGYARQVRVWRRGTLLSKAQLLLEIPATDMGVWPHAWGTGVARRAVIDQRATFWAGKLYHVQAEGLVESPLPGNADFRLIADVGAGPAAFALLRTAWRGMPAGSLVAYPVPMDGPMETDTVSLVYAPLEQEAIREIRATANAIYVAMLSDVSARLKHLTPNVDGWQEREIQLPENSALTLMGGDEADSLYFAIDSFVEPPRLMRVDGVSPPIEIAAAPAFFDADRFVVSQQFAISPDGTKIPWFLVRPKGVAGPLPALLWAYGGFEIPLVPAYITPDVQFWLEDGGQYIVANIRGGGEYGPEWHQAALKENRQRSYDDLHAVAEDAKKRKLVDRIAVHGRSNGGLMASVAYTQRPDLYAGALVGVPLADMQRYHKLLAGASWVGEYGDPDISGEWDFIRSYSPYQNIRPDTKYPRVFFYTSTKDDRVHPGHARKMAARMTEQGHPVYYYENTDGGHAGVANLKESAYRYALIRAYLEREVK